MKPESVFERFIARVRAENVVIDRIELSLEWESGLALIVNIGNGELGERRESVGYNVAGVVHTDGVGLHHCGVAIYVDNQAGEEIALAMHQTVGIIVGPDQSERLAETESLGKPVDVKDSSKPVSANEAASRPIARSLTAMLPIW